MRTIPGRLLCVGFVLAGFMACGPRLPLQRGPTLAPEYQSELVRFTRDSNIYQRLDRVAAVRATRWTDSLRGAFTQQYRVFFGLEPQPRDTDLEWLAEPTMGDARGFLVFLETAEPSWNNLELSESAWRLSLESPPGGARVLPLKVRRLMGRGPNLGTFFPFVTDFMRVYWVGFPAASLGDAAEARLSIASAMGAATLTWSREP